MQTQGHGSWAQLCDDVHRVIIMYPMKGKCSVMQSEYLYYLTVRKCWHW